MCIFYLLAVLLTFCPSWSKQDRLNVKGVKVFNCGRKNDAVRLETAYFSDNPQGLDLTLRVRMMEVIFAPVRVNYYVKRKTFFTWYTLPFGGTINDICSYRCPVAKGTMMAITKTFRIRAVTAMKPFLIGQYSSRVTLQHKTRQLACYFIRFLIT